jgi:YggT family protein
LASPPVKASGAAPGCGPGSARLHELHLFSGKRRARIMLELLGFISYVLQLYVYVLIASAVLSWLIAFNVVNMRNQFVAGLAQVLHAVTEPVLRPIRNILPDLGGIDISPIVVILIIIFIQGVILPNIARALL